MKSCFTAALSLKDPAPSVEVLIFRFLTAMQNGVWCIERHDNYGRLSRILADAV